MDLRQPEARGIVHRLIEVDVVVINYRPGVAGAGH
jgi:crotonobetainyl-CoA:carnitine CoA-transferase CaiB-like acyl-CoA transferase